LLERTLGDFQYSHVVFGPRLLDDDIATGAAFMRAYLRGVRAFVGGDTPRFLDDFARRFHMKLELVKAACRNNISLTGEIRLADLERWLAWAASKGYLTRTLGTQEIVDLRFQEAARGTALYRRSSLGQC
jgi:hypothetical protein